MQGFRRERGGYEPDWFHKRSERERWFSEQDMRPMDRQAFNDYGDDRRGRRDEFFRGRGWGRENYGRERWEDVRRDRGRQSRPKYEEKNRKQRDRSRSRHYRDRSANDEKNSFGHRMRKNEREKSNDSIRSQSVSVPIKNKLSTEEPDSEISTQSSPISSWKNEKKTDGKGSNGSKNVGVIDIEIIIANETDVQDGTSTHMEEGTSVESGISGDDKENVSEKEKLKNHAENDTKQEVKKENMNKSEKISSLKGIKDDKKCESKQEESFCNSLNSLKQNVSGNDAKHCQLGVFLNGSKEKHTLEIDNIKATVVKGKLPITADSFNLNGNIQKQTDESTSHNNKFDIVGKILKDIKPISTKSQPASRELDKNGGQKREHSVSSNCNLIEDTVAKANKGTTIRNFAKEYQPKVERDNKKLKEVKTVNRHNENTGIENIDKKISKERVEHSIGKGFRPVSKPDIDSDYAKEYQPKVERDNKKMKEVKKVIRHNENTGIESIDKKISKEGVEHNIGKGFRPGNKPVVDSDFAKEYQPKVEKDNKKMKEVNKVIRHNENTGVENIDKKISKEGFEHNIGKGLRPGSKPVVDSDLHKPTNKETTDHADKILNTSEVNAEDRSYDIVGKIMDGVDKKIKPLVTSTPFKSNKNKRSLSNERSNTEEKSFKKACLDKSKTVAERVDTYENKALFNKNKPRKSQFPGSSANTESKYENSSDKSNRKSCTQSRQNIFESLHINGVPAVRKDDVMSKKTNSVNMSETSVPDNCPNEDKMIATDTHQNSRKKVNEACHSGDSEYVKKGPFPTTSGRSRRSSENVKTKHLASKTISSSDSPIVKVKGELKPATTNDCITVCSSTKSVDSTKCDFASKIPCAPDNVEQFKEELRSSLGVDADDFELIDIRPSSLYEPSISDISDDEQGVEKKDISKSVKYLDDRVFFEKKVVENRNENVVVVEKEVEQHTPCKIGETTKVVPLKKQLFQSPRRKYCDRLEVVSKGFEDSTEPLNDTPQKWVETQNTPVMKHMAKNFFQKAKRIKIPEAKNLNGQSEKPLPLESDPQENLSELPVHHIPNAPTPQSPEEEKSNEESNKAIDKEKSNVPVSNSNERESSEKVSLRRNADNLGFAGLLSEDELLKELRFKFNISSEDSKSEDTDYSNMVLGHRLQVRSCRRWLQRRKQNIVISNDKEELLQKIAQLKKQQQLIEGNMKLLHQVQQNPTRT